jgi:hypothetical protein
MSEAVVEKSINEMVDEYGCNPWGDQVTVKRPRKCLPPYNRFRVEQGTHIQFDPETGRQRTYHRGEEILTPMDVDLTTFNAKGMNIKFSRIFDAVGMAAAQGFNTIYTDTATGVNETPEQYKARLRKLLEEAEQPQKIVAATPDTKLPGAVTTPGAKLPEPSVMAKMNQQQAVVDMFATMDLNQLKRFAEDEEIDLRACKGNEKAIRDLLIKGRGT